MNIYVSHLSWGTKSDSLQNLFSQYGEVSSANVITCLLYTSDAADEL